MVECKQIIFNIPKSNIILINDKKHNKTNNNFFDNLVKFASDIPILQTSKFLGVVFDNALTFQCHIQNLVKNYQVQLEF